MHKVLKFPIIPIRLTTFFSARGKAIALSSGTHKEALLNIVNLNEDNPKERTLFIEQWLK